MVYRNPTFPVPVDVAHRIASNVSNYSYKDLYGRVGYWYVVTAVNANGTSLPSAQVQASTYCMAC